jgi:hypothetical protein
MLHKLDQIEQKRSVAPELPQNPKSQKTHEKCSVPLSAFVTAWWKNELLRS